MANDVGPVSAVSRTEEINALVREHAGVRGALSEDTDLCGDLRMLEPDLDELLVGKRPTATQAAHGSRARDRQVGDMRRIDVGPRPAGRDALAAWYAEALDVQRASGLSVAEFAPRIGVSAPTFYAWRRRLAAAAPRELPAQLVELTVARGSSPAAATGPMVVQLCAGRRSIEVPAGFDGAELQRLVAAIESC